MKKLKKVSFIIIPALLLIPGIVIVKSVSSSPSRIVLKDQMKIDKIVLHDAKGDHACHCYPPIISGWQINDITGSSATISFKCNQAATYQVNYGTSSGKGTRVPATRPTTYLTTGSVTITGLKPNTTYHVGPYAQVKSGYPVKTWLQQDRGQSDFTFKTLAAATAYSIKGSVLDDKGAGINGVKLTISGDSAGSITTTNPGTYEFANLKQGKNYKITPTKSGYNFSPENKSYNSLSTDQNAQNYVGQLLTAVKIDYTKQPLIYDVIASKITTTDATITWKTNIPSTSEIEFGKTKNYGFTTGKDTKLSTDHYLQLFDLTPGATYYFKAVSGLGNESSSSSSSSDFSLTTQLFEKRIVDKTSYFTEPNPCANKVEFHYYLYQPVSNLTIDVLTLSGKKVAVLESPSSALNTGWNRISWDVKDRSSIPLVNGLYVYTMKIKKGSDEEVMERSQFMVRR